MLGGVDPPALLQSFCKCQLTVDASGAVSHVPFTVRLMFSRE